MMPISMKLAGRSLAAIAMLATAAAAQVTIPVPPQSQTVVLRGATLHTVTKGMEGGQSAEERCHKNESPRQMMTQGPRRKA